MAKDILQQQGLQMEEIFRRRPFKVRNADEYDVFNILNLFVSPINGLATPFDYENTIVKGRMGSGKTMYLRANHAYYLSTLVPALIEESSEVILPVFIRLNDFQHIRDPENIYRAIVLKVIEELCSIYLHLEDMKNLASIQSGLKHVPETLITDRKLADALKQIKMLGGDEYIERVSHELGLNGGVRPKFLELSASWKETEFAEIKRKPNPGIKDIEESYKTLLGGQHGKILLLIDEAGSLDKSFFRQGEDQCFFEILMNQFRTASFIRTKVAVYPDSYSDMLTETRYGDTVILEDDIYNTQGYQHFRSKLVSLIENYINPDYYENHEWVISDFFDIENSDTTGDAIEQIIFASNGNMRRVMQLLDLTMEAAYIENNSPTKIKKSHAIKALQSHAKTSEDEYNSQDLELLDSLVTVCKARATFKFQFPNVPLYKYTNRSQEYNLISVIQLGSGRRPTTYAFDYSYAVAKGIPTHRMTDSEKINHDRTLANGRWLTRLATVNQELIDHATLPGKLTGTIDYIHEKGEGGLITCDVGENYYFNQAFIIDSDKSKKLMVGKRTRFYPSELNGAQVAAMIEVLD